VLGVSRDAGPAEIKAAWRTATDKFEPGSGAGQFRMFNEAADVLLDPARRAAYDKSLEAPTNRGTAAPPAPVTLEKDAGDPAPAHPPTHTTLTKKARTWRRPTVPAVIAGRPGGSEPASGPAKLAAVVLTVLCLIAIGLAVWLGLQVRSDARVADARDTAPAAAEEAAKTIFAYDYRHLDADEKRAKTFLTPSFAPRYLKNFQQLKQQKDGAPGLAVQSKTVLTANVLGSGVVDAQADKVRVLVYVNQVSKKPGASPQIFQNRVAMTMTKDGDRWLVDGVKSY
jgi:Mce-associated membrane protein